MDAMQLNPSQYALDCENYRLANGKHSLFSFRSCTDGKLWVVKKATLDEVLLYGVLDEAELTVTAAEFATGFQWFAQDESVFFFGSKEQQEAAHRLLLAQSDAVKRCVYGKAQLPAVIQ